MLVALEITKQRQLKIFTPVYLYLSKYQKIWKLMRKYSIRKYIYIYVRVCGSQFQPL